MVQDKIIRKMKEINIIKASGEREPFSEEKLRQSLGKARVSHSLTEAAVRKITGEIKDGMTTSEIYDRVFDFLREEERAAAGRYNLKRALFDLGPTGHPFEKLVGELLKERGYSVEVGKIIPGVCVSHEVDVIAEKGKKHIIVECKYHNQPGAKSDVKVALYVQARFEDIKKRFEMNPDHGERFHSIWIATNTKFTGDAISYAECVGMFAVGWNHPSGNSLQKMIESSGSHPLTCLTSLSRNQKQTLLDRGLVLCRDIIANSHLLSEIGIGEPEGDQVMREINELCQTK